MERLTHKTLPLAARAQSVLCGIRTDPNTSVSRALLWLKTCWESGHDHLPYLLVHDLGHILLQGREVRFASAEGLSHWPEEERSVRLAYEDQLLGQWALDPSVRAVHITVAGLPQHHQDAAVAHALGLALAGPLLRSAVGLLRGNPAHLREMTGALAAVLSAPSTPEDRGVDAAWLAWGLAQMSALQPLWTGRLLGDEDLWEIDHLESLSSESARMALRAVHEGVSRVGPLPQGALSLARQRRRQVPIDETAADTYPTGGFDAVSTRGSTENIVRSEIVYVGEGKLDEDAARSIDLFDLRYLEGELLYYTRDDSPLLDAHRLLQIAVHRPASLRFKHAPLMAQTLVMVEALLLVLHTDLVRTFGAAASRTEISWVTDSDADIAVAAEETALLSLPLAPELAHHRIAFLTRDATVPFTKGSIVFSPLAAPSRFVGHWIRVDGEQWQLGEQTIDASSLSALRELATRLLLVTVA